MLGIGTARDAGGSELCKIEADRMNRIFRGQPAVLSMSDYFDYAIIMTMLSNSAENTFSVVGESRCVGFVSCMLRIISVQTRECGCCVWQFVWALTETIILNKTADICSLVMPQGIFR